MRESSEILALVPWNAILLVIGFPVLLLIVNEILASCERRGFQAARTLRTFRNLVLPALALQLFAKLILELPREDSFARVVETAFWVCLLYALLSLVNDVVFGAAEPGSWREKVPGLFRDLAKAVLVAIGAMFIYSMVWDREIEGAITALGIGSVVIGLALQEPLGNIVSGLKLLFERPLAVGDWVSADGVTGRVIEINWRSVHIETPTRELRVIPNVSLYKGAFSNLSRPTPLRGDSIEIGFSYDDPPNRVKEVMLDMLSGTPGVLSDPPPAVRTINYADFSIIYRMGFSVARQEELAATRDRIMTRLWYVARRAGLTIPFPIQMEYSPGENPGQPSPSPSSILARHPRFKPALNPELPDRQPSVVDYAKGEPVQRHGSRFEGFALVLTGEALLYARNQDGQDVQVGAIGPGECFGDHGTAGAPTTDISIIASTDLRVMVFNPEDIGNLLHKAPALAAEIGDAIEARRRASIAARNGR
ncbi:MAG: mechanosensitive ion channel [Planctomycetes bacterium]|nr:mechanosensitive ion channel [Planctomycetota bacterium]